jgi:hypothetical protein
MTPYSFNATKSPRPLKHGGSRDEQIRQWAVEVAVTAEPVDAFEDLTSLVPQYLVSSRQPVHSAHDRGSTALSSQR